MSPSAKARALRQLAFELEALADQVEQQSRCLARAELLIAEGERIARGIWRIFRGCLD